MKKVLLLLSLLLISSISFADNRWSHMVCKGTDTVGNPVYLLADSNSSVVNINGDVLNIVGKTVNGKGVVTQNFIATNGVLVYDSIVPTSNVTLAIFQFNAVTQVLLARADLSCGFSGNLGAQVLNMNIFNKLKKNTK